MKPLHDAADLLERSRVDVSADGSTVWVHGTEGDTIGRFSKRFGMDVHTTVQNQLDGAPQCLVCTHKPAILADWIEFCRLMFEHHQVQVDQSAIQFLNERVTS